MGEQFNPYHRWLAIPLEEQPPNHYRLLGCKTLEADTDVIETAADRQMAHVRGYQSGEHAHDAERLLNEIAAAKLVLLKPAEKSAYDAQLKKVQEPKMVRALPLEDSPSALAAPPSRPPDAGPAIHTHVAK